MKTLPCLVLVGLTAWLMAGASRAAGTNSHVKLSADNIEYYPKNGFTVCESNVVVTVDAMKLQADRVVAYQDSSTPAKGRESFSRIVATGNVRLFMTAPDRRVYGQRGVYESASRTVHITGSPMVEMEGGQQVRANVIVYDMAKDKITFHGAQGGMTMTDEITKEWQGLSPAGGK